MPYDRIVLDLPQLDHLRIARGLSKTGLAREAGIAPDVVTKLYAQGYASPVTYGRLLNFFRLEPGGLAQEILPGKKAVAVS